MEAPGSRPAEADAPPAVRPGFRIDAIDVLVLAAGAVAATVAGRLDGGLGLVVALPVGNFFLFCNVFRVDRPLELAWAALFVMSSAGTLLAGWPGWPATLAASMAGTVGVIVAQARRPSYRGIGWRRINPGLEARRAAANPGPAASALPEDSSATH